MTSDGRRDQRQTLALKIRFKSATLSDFIEQNSADISRGGMFVKMSSPMPVGTLIKFDLRLEDDQSLVQGVGRVVWRREESTEGASAGMGIKFIKLDETSRGNLETIIQSKVERKKGESALPPSVVPVTGPPSKMPSPIAPVRPRSVPKKKQKTLVGTPSVAPAVSEASEPESGKEDEEERETVVVDQVTGSKESKPLRFERSTAPPAPLQEMSAGVEWDEEDSDPHEMATVIASIPEMNALLGDESTTGREDNTAKVVIGKTEVKAISDSRREEDETAKLELAKHKEAMAARVSSGKGEEKTPDQLVEDKDTWEQDGKKAGGQAENGLLEDISVAIDSALHEGKGKGGKDEAQSESKSGKGQEGQTERQEPPKAKDAFPQTPVELDESSSRGSGFAIAVWIMLGLAGVAIWYFMFGPGRVTEDVAETFADEEAFSTTPLDQETPVAGEEPATTPADEEPATTPEEVATTAVEVSLQPPDARLYLDGELQKGRAPFTVNLERGREIELRAVAWGYVSKTQKLEVTEETKKLQLNLEKAEVHAVFTIEPRGASIVVNDVRWGLTPNVVKRKGIPREFTYKISKPGYEDLEGKVVAGDWKEEDGVYVVTLGGELKKSEQAQPVPWRRPKPKSDDGGEQAGVKEAAPESPAVKPAAEKKPEPAKAPEAEKKPEPAKAPEAAEKPAPKKEPAEEKIQPKAVEENPF